MKQAALGGWPMGCEIDNPVSFLSFLFQVKKTKIKEMRAVDNKQKVEGVAGSMKAGSKVNHGRRGLFSARWVREAEGTGGKRQLIGSASLEDVNMAT